MLEAAGSILPGREEGAFLNDRSRVIALRGSDGRNVLLKRRVESGPAKPRPRWVECRPLTKANPMAYGGRGLILLRQCRPGIAAELLKCVTALKRGPCA